MSYQVLARKWRPANFREMVGQEHVLKALINALDHNRLHHAYLFTGTRGVGKTTIARILAKCLNCEVGVSSAPCGECGACREISEGRFVDLIEVDAASRTKVEDTRELLDNVQYAPTRGRYKIYLIDEVHMLSNHSFNALLKTLEEPPEHVKFLLATTDPQKLPVTILSRCLQFNLKNMSPERIAGHLDFILEKEAVPFEESALWLLARAADGSMRDALSLTDQSIAYGNGKVVEQDVANMLGTIDHKLVQRLIDALIESDGKAMLNAIAKFAEHAPDFHAALGDMLTLLHRIAIAQALPEALDNSYGDRKIILEFARQLTPEDVQLFYQTALIGRRDLYLASEPRSGFEMTLLRMLAFKPQGLVDVPTRPLQPANQTSSSSGVDSTAASGERAAAAPDSPEPSALAPPAHQAEFDQAAVADKTAQDHTADNYYGEDNSNTEASTPVKKSLAEAAIEPSSISTESISAVTDAADVHANDVNPTIAPAAGSGESARASAGLAEPESNTVNHQINGRGVEPANEVARELKQRVKDLVGKEGITEPPKTKASIPSASLNVESNSNPSVANKPPLKPRPTAAKIALDAFGPDQWVSVFRQLNIKGILQSTAVNCVLLGREENRLHFGLDETKGSLFDTSHIQRLTGILTDYFAQPVVVDVHLQAIPEGFETPAQCADREKLERHHAALHSLASDPIVQTLEREFGASLDEQTLSFTDQ
ncbi:DNA polymerase III subunit gamma/tau [Teredinibacter waterburyi]|uniref:DNA polymerase III subunit gamma/tau n=1 Tax=Teredinibacter waterburyi TaxID=1500538 RepID=UPI00165F4E2F|nr:DNA polymerase III subunit gamma/tau [Teredinibacter waterburyi]